MYTTTTNMSTPGKCKRPADLNSFEACILERVDNLHSQLKQADEIELYLQSLLSTFRCLDSAKKSMAKMEIVKVLHKLEFWEEWILISRGILPFSCTYLISINIAKICTELFLYLVQTEMGNTI